MTGGDEPHEDEFSPAAAPHAERAWRHPSEVGMATRGTADRRRTSRIASIVIAGGVGLLVGAVLVGGLSEPRLTATASEALPMPPSVVTVSASLEDRVAVAAGIVVDDDGRVLVDPANLGLTDLSDTTIWVERHDGRERPASVLATDLPTGLALIAADEPAGSAAVTADGIDTGDQLSVVAAGVGGPTEVGTASAIIGGAQVTLLGSIITETGSDADTWLPPEPLSATIATGSGPPGAWLFDRWGDLAGMVSGHLDDDRIAIIDADSLMGIADRLTSASG